MPKKLLALVAICAITYGAASASIPTEIPIESDCLGFCAPTITLPGGAVCVLAGCLSGGGQVFCIHNCFFPLPF